MKTTDSLLEFPCTFPIKVVGCPADDFIDLVVDLISRHVDPVDRNAIATRSSRGGKYLAVTITIQAGSREQMDRVYHELSAHPRIIMAL